MSSQDLTRARTENQFVAPPPYFVFIPQIQLTPEQTLLTLARVWWPMRYECSSFRFLSWKVRMKYVPAFQISGNNVKRDDCGLTAGIGPLGVSGEGIDILTVGKSWSRLGKWDKNLAVHLASDILAWILYCFFLFLHDFARPRLGDKLAPPRLSFLEKSRPENMGCKLHSKAIYNHVIVNLIEFRVLNYLILFLSSIRLYLRFSSLLQPNWIKWVLFRPL